MGPVIPTTTEIEYLRVAQFSLEKGFLANPLMACIKLARFKFVSKMLSPCDRVLDLGCGSGYSSYFYTKSAQHVLGVDVYAEFEHARRTFVAENLEYMQADVLHPPKELLSKRFTAIASVDVIEHFYRDDGEAIISTCYDLLETGGMLILDTVIYSV